MAEKVNVIWASYHRPEILARGYWDQGLLEDIFAKGNYSHLSETDEVPEGEGAIFIINGRTHTEDADKINETIAKLRWVLFIDTGDEEAVFPWRDVKHPIMRVWVMLPRMNHHNDTSFKLPNGYRTDTPKILKTIGRKERELDFMFVGQVNHARREQCIEAATSIQTQYNALITGTDGFGKEALNQHDYLEAMASAKVVLCPSGIESPDNFRLYEALEAGCIPIVDAFATNNQDWGFWRYLFGDKIPFPIIDYWDKLPELLPQILDDYPRLANKTFAWWQLYKRKLKHKLEEDVRILNG